MPLRFLIDIVLERKFREAAEKRFGTGKGALSRAAEEAILDWLLSRRVEPVPFVGDPVKAIEGLLKGVDADSVALQHEAQKRWAEKALKKASAGNC